MPPSALGLLASMRAWYCDSIVIGTLRGCPLGASVRAMLIFGTLGAGAPLFPRGGGEPMEYPEMLPGSPAFQLLTPPTLPLMMTADWLLRSDTCTQKPEAYISIVLSFFHTGDALRVYQPLMLPCMIRCCLAVAFGHLQRTWLIIHVV